MTDLIKRLREADSYNKKYYALDPLHQEAADRIEALVEELDEARHLQSCACNYDAPTDVCMGHHALFERLYAAERAKLEARIEALVKERDDYAHKLMDANNTYTEMHLEIERLSDKLTEAVAGLRKIADHKHFSWEHGWIQNTEARIASATLAKLEGKG